jgi:hypothetical protein
MSLGEGKFQVWQEAMIGFRRREKIGILPVEFDIAGATVAGALAAANGLQNVRCAHENTLAN